jgi:hypothetical protein
MFDPNQGEALGKMKESISKAEKAEFDKIKGKEKELSPLKVELVSYISGGLATPRRQSVYEFGSDQDFTIGPYIFTDMMAEFANGKTFFPGCAYDVDQLKYALIHYSDWDKIKNWNGLWDFLDDTLSGAGNAYQALQFMLASLIAFYINQSGIASCGAECQANIMVGIKIGLAYLGIPPDLPSAHDLYEKGASYLAMQIASYMIGVGLESYPELASIPLGTTALEEAAESLAMKALPPNPFNQSGVWYCDPSLGCGSYYLGALPESWGKPSPFGVDSPAIVYLRVSPQPQGLRFGDILSIRIRSKTGIWEDREIPVDLRFLKKPMVIPVALKPKLDFNEPTAQEGNGFVNVGLVQAAWYQKKFGGAKGVSSQLEISSSYRWTSKNLLYSPQYIQVNWANHDGLTTKDQDFGLMKAKGTAVYGQVPQPPPCPAFYWTEAGLRYKGAE